MNFYFLILFILISCGEKSVSSKKKNDENKPGPKVEKPGGTVTCPDMALRNHLEKDFAIIVIELGEMERKSDFNLGVTIGKHAKSWPLDFVEKLNRKKRFDSLYDVSSKKLSITDLLNELCQEGVL